MSRKNFILFSIVAIYLISIFFLKGLDDNALLFAVIQSIISAVLILFSREIGSLTGDIGWHYVDETSPAIFIEILGWIFLLLPIICIVLARIF